MINQSQLDSLAARLVSALPSELCAGACDVQAELRQCFRDALQAGLARLDLVSREEFDAALGVLRRTREKLEQLEKQLANKSERL